MNNTASLPAAQASLPQSAKGIYSLQSQIPGHTGAVLCISVTNDGKLASGGVDGTQVWDIQRILSRQPSKEATALQAIRPFGAGDRGATTALAWIRREDEPDNGLIFGTARGLIILWKETSGSDTVSYIKTYSAHLSNSGEVTLIAFDSGTNRVAISNRNSVVQLFRVGSTKLDLHPIFSVSIHNHVPKAITFGETGIDKAIYTFGLYDGYIYTLNGKDGSVQHTCETGCQIEGVSIYRFDSCDRIRTYPVAVEKSMRPRQVAFIEDCKLLLSGSDHGAVYIFDRRSGKTIDILRSGTADRIQALTATEHLESPTIFSSACRSLDEACTINVWRKSEVVQNSALVKEDPKVRKVKHPGIGWMLRDIITACLLLIAIAFVNQNKHYLVY